MILIFWWHHRQTAIEVILLRFFFLFYDDFCITICITVIRTFRAFSVEYQHYIVIFVHLYARGSTLYLI